MRTLILNQFEFDSWSSEESLEIHVAWKKELNGIIEFPDLRAFVCAAAGPGLAEILAHPVHFDDGAGYGLVRTYLQRFAGIDVPEPCEWIMRTLVADACEFDCILESPELYIRYRWSSTA